MTNLFFLFLALFFSISYCYIKMPVLTAAGEIWDLYASGDIRDILALGDDWLVVPYIHYARQKVTLCNWWYFLGGPGISSGVGYFERTWTNLPTHSLAYYSIPLQMIGTWSSTDSFSIIMDGVTISTWTTANYTVATCSSLGLIQSVGGKIVHSASTLTLKIAFNIYSSNSNPASLIAKDVYFSFRNSTETALVSRWTSSGGCPSGSSSCSCTTDCQVCFGSSSTQCARCEWGVSDYGSGCGACTSNCLLCSGSGSSQCTLCDVGYTLTLDGTCVTSCPTTSVTMTNGRYSFCIAPCPAGQYMMWNWTCGASCDGPLTQTASTPTTYCNYPCDQENGQYLYWNGTCSSSCAYYTRNESWYYFCDLCPQGYWYYQNGSCLSTCQENFDQTTVNSTNYCNYPCTSSQFLYPNGTCMSTCQLDFSERIEGSYKFCDYPCALSDYLYPNGTCQSSCQVEFNVRLEGSFQFCDYPCQLSQFLYPNGSCMSNCQIDFNQRTEGPFQFCDYPCALSDYLYPNATCKIYCQDLFNIRVEGSSQFCDYPCQLSQFLYPNGTCMSTCQTTFSQRTEGSFQFCDFPCALSEYLYPNGTCQSYCQDLFSPRIENLYLFCDYPCQLSEFLYQNDSCLSTCQTNFVERTEGSFQFCTYPCSSTEFLYPNGTCLSSCQDLFSTRIEGTYQFCDYPCQLSEFLYQNDSCLSTCQENFLQRTEGSFQFCTYPCDSTEYLYLNGSCLSTCQTYFNVRTEGTYQFCDFPCNSNEYLYQDGTCSSTCKKYYDQHLEQSVLHFCDYPCTQTGYWLASDGTCTTTSTLSNGTQTVLSGSQKASSTITQAASLLTSGSAITISASVAGRIFFNIKYLNISYSEELQEALKNWSQSFISDDLTPDLPQSVKKEIPSRHVPYMFEKYNVVSSFLINYWESLGMIILALLAVISVALLELSMKLFKKHETYLGVLITKIKIMMQNFFVITLYGVYGDLVMYAIIEYRSIKFRRDLSLLSFIISVTLLFIMFTGFILHFLLLKKYQNIKKKQEKSHQDSEVLENFSKDYPGLEVLYRDYTDRSLERQAFLLTLTIRDIIFSILICTLFDYPLVQTAILCINSFFTIFYLVDRKPFKNRLDLMQQIFFEMIGLTVNISVLLNCVQDDSQENTSTIIVNIGKFVIAMNMVYNFFVAALMFLQIFIIIHEQWKAWKLKRKNKKVTPTIRVHRTLTLNNESSAIPINPEPSLTINLESLQVLSGISVSRSFSIDESAINGVSLINLKNAKSIHMKRRRIF